MVEVEISDKYFDEKSYVFEVIFKDILNTDYSIKINNSSEGYRISYLQKSVFIEDHFFSGLIGDSYLSHKVLPSELVQLDYHTGFADDITAFYGTSVLESNDTLLRIGADIIGTGFFLLSRLEEVVIKEKDDHGRFCHTFSFAFRNGIIHRALVNEYADLIAEWLGIRSNSSYTVSLTHDIDFIRKWNNPIQWVRTISGDLFKRGSLSLFGKNISWYLGILIGTKKDPYNIFSEMEEFASYSDEKPIYYFISGGNTNYDTNYHISGGNASRAIKHILNKGFEIGLHSSYNAIIGDVDIKTEKSALEKIAGNVNFIRQHFLRFSVPEIWTKSEKAGFLVDSSMIFPLIFGFRTGCCSKHRVFDVRERKMLNIYELPVSVMDTTLIHYSDDEYLEGALSIVRTIKKHKGSFVFLMHNSNINDHFWKSKQLIFKKILTEARN